MSGPVHAQEATRASSVIAAGATLPGTPVSLYVEDADLYSVLRLLFKQAKMDFSLAPSLRDSTITLSLNKKPFSVALDIVLSGLSVTTSMEGGVFTIRPETSEDNNGAGGATQESTDTAPADSAAVVPNTPVSKGQLYRLQVNHDLGALADALGVSIIRIQNGAARLSSLQTGSYGNGFGNGYGGAGNTGNNNTNSGSGLFGNGTAGNSGFGGFGAGFMNPPGFEFANTNFFGSEFSSMNYGSGFNF